MGRRMMHVVVGIIMGVGALLVAPSLWAADGDVAPAGGGEATRDQILREIEATRRTDPELAIEMERQLELMDPGELHVEGPERAAANLREAISRLEADGNTEQAGKLTEVLEKLGRGEITPEQSYLEARELFGEWPGFRDGDDMIGPPGMIGPPDMIGPPIGVGTEGDYLPPEVRAQLEKLFDEKGTGDPAKDAHVREEAEQILREHGIEPREMWRDQPGERGGWERDWRYEGDVVPIGIDKDFQGTGDHERLIREQEFEMPTRETRGHEHEHERSTREHEMPTREYDRPTRESETSTREYEMPARDAEAPTRESETSTREYEMPARDYETPTHEYEAPVREYETPTHEYEAPTREYEAPIREYEAPTREYERPESYTEGMH